MKNNKRSKLADRITPWTDSEHPTAYFKRFEDIMQEAGIGKEQWPSRFSRGENRALFFSNALD